MARTMATPNGNHADLTGNEMTRHPAINRFAVVLLPTQACLDWIKSCVGNDNNLTDGNVTKAESGTMRRETHDGEKSGDTKDS